MGVLCGLMPLCWLRHCMRYLLSSASCAPGVLSVRLGRSIGVMGCRQSNFAEQVLVGGWPINRRGSGDAEIAEKISLIHAGRSARGWFRGGNGLG